MNNFKLFLFLFTFSIFMACGDDDGPQEGGESNLVTYDGNSYALSGGVLERYGSNGDGVSYDWDLTLVGGTLTINSDGIGEEGEGPELYFDLNSNSGTGLVTGIYSYSDTRKEFSYVDGALETASFDTDLENGTIEVLDANINSLSIIFNVFDEDGKSVTGSYNGSVTLIQ